MSERYTDIHTHILPAIDDGAKNMEESMEMLNSANEAGIEKLFLTPHYHQEFYPYDPGDLDKLFSELSYRAKLEFPDLSLYLGNEICYTSSTVADLNVGKIHTMDGSRYILVEFHASITFSELYFAIKELTQARYLPIIAHVERYFCLDKEFDYLDDLEKQGAYFQMDICDIQSPSIREECRWKRRMLKDRVIHFIGSDIHRPEQGGQSLGKSMAWITHKLPEEYGRKLSWENAQAITNHEYL